MKKICLVTLLLVLVLSLASCDLPEITPPSEVPLASPTPDEQYAPQPSPTEPPVENVLESIHAGNVQNLVLNHKAAVSNIQRITFSADSRVLGLTTQNSDASDQQIYSLTMLNAQDLSTRSVFTSTEQRIAAVNPDGQMAILLDQAQNSFSLIDTLDNGKILQTVILPQLINGISVSPDSRYIAVSMAEAWEVVLYDFNTLEVAQTLTGFETAAPVYNAEFDHSPQWMVWHVRGTIQLQEVETGVMGPQFLHEDFVSAFALSADGTLLASAAGKTVNSEMVPAVTLWDTSTGAELRVIKLDASANAMAFSPDGKLLAIAVDKNIQVWDPVNGTLVATLSGHSDMITQVAFSPDQKTIASSGLDNQLYLWQVVK